MNSKGVTKMKERQTKLMAIDISVIFNTLEEAIKKADALKNI